MGKSKKHKSNVFSFHTSHITVAELAKGKLFVGGISQTINTTMEIVRLPGSMELKIICIISTYILISIVLVNLW